MRKLPYIAFREPCSFPKSGEPEGWFWRVEKMGDLESDLESLLEHLFLGLFSNLCGKEPCREPLRDARSLICWAMMHCTKIESQF